MTEENKSPWASDAHVHEAEQARLAGHGQVDPIPSLKKLIAKAIEASETNKLPNDTKLSMLCGFVVDRIEEFMGPTHLVMLVAPHNKDNIPVDMKIISTVEPTQIRLLMDAADAALDHMVETDTSGLTSRPTNQGN